MKIEPLPVELVWRRRTPTAGGVYGIASVSRRKHVNESYLRPLADGSTFRITSAQSRFQMLPSIFILFSIRSVTPDKIQITTADFLNVSLENMGDTKGSLKCSFRFPDGRIVDSEPAFPIEGWAFSSLWLIIWFRTLRCPTPSMNRLPPLGQNMTALQAILSIVAGGHSTPIASSNFSFYDCGRHTTCSQCAKSEFPCDWCLESNECVAGKLTEDKCRKQHIVNGLNVSFSSVCF